MKKFTAVLFMLLLAHCAYAIPPYDTYMPIEWYQVPSLFFRNLTGEVVPVIATDGFKLPVDTSVTFTIGTQTFTVALPFKSATATQTQALVDSGDRQYVNLASDTIGLNVNIASITAKIVEHMLQQATETIAMQLAVDTVATNVINLAAQQASETLAMQLAVDSVATDVINLAAQQATETIDMLAYLASITLSIVSTPTVALDNGSNTLGSVTALIPPIASGTSITLTTSTIATDIPAYPGRVGVFIQNISTEAVHIKTWSDVASPTFSGASFCLQQWDSMWFPYGEEVPIGYVSSSPGIIQVDQGVSR